MAAKYEIAADGSGVAVEITGVGHKQQELLNAFGDCAAGKCSCPTDEYQKVADMEVVPSDDAISIRLRGKPGTEFDTGEIRACLAYTVDKAEQES